jgi:hypothetical protein
MKRYRYADMISITFSFEQSQIFSFRLSGCSRRVVGRTLEIEGRLVARPEPLSRRMRIQSHTQRNACAPIPEVLKMLRPAARRFIGSSASCDLCASDKSRFQDLEDLNDG